MTPPQTPPPHLLTRILASPAAVSPTPSGPTVWAVTGAAANNVVSVTTTRPNLQDMETSPRKTRLLSNKWNLGNAVSAVWQRIFAFLSSIRFGLLDGIFFRAGGQCISRRG